MLGHHPSRVLPADSTVVRAGPGPASRHPDAARDAEVESVAAESVLLDDLPDALRNTFNIFDTDGDGRLNVVELRRVVASVQRSREATALPIEDFPVGLRNDLRAFDRDGDGIINFVEISKAARMYADTQRANRFMKRAICLGTALIVVILGVITGLTAAVVELSKEMHTRDGALTDREGRPVSTAQFLESAPLSSALPDEAFQELKYLIISSPTGAKLQLFVLGFARLPNSESRHGSIVKLVTYSGTVVVDDTQLVFSEGVAPLFREAGFAVDSSQGPRRRLLGVVQLIGFFNTLAAAANRDASAANITLPTMPAQFYGRSRTFVPCGASDGCGNHHSPACLVDGECEETVGHVDLQYREATGAFKFYDEVAWSLQQDGAQYLRRETVNVRYTNMTQVDVYNSTHTFSFMRYRNDDAQLEQWFHCTLQAGPPDEAMLGMEGMAVGYLGQVALDFTGQQAIGYQAYDADLELLMYTSVAGVPQLVLAVDRHLNAPMSVTHFTLTETLSSLAPGSPEFAIPADLSLCVHPSLAQPELHDTWAGPPVPHDPDWGVLNLTERAQTPLDSGYEDALMSNFTQAGGAARRLLASVTRTMGPCELTLASNPLEVVGSCNKDYPPALPLINVKGEVSVRANGGKGCVVLTLLLGNILKRVGITSKKVIAWVKDKFSVVGTICVGASTERYAHSELYGHWTRGALQGPPQLGLFGELEASGSIAIASGKARISVAIYGGLCTPFYNADQVYQDSYTHASFSAKAWVKLKALGFTIFSDTLYYPSEKKTTVTINGQKIAWGHVHANVMPYVSGNRFSAGVERYETLLMDRC